MLLPFLPPAGKGGWKVFLKPSPHLYRWPAEKMTFHYRDKSCHTQNFTCRDAGISFHAFPVKVYG